LKIASGPDGFSSHMLRETAASISPALLNLSFKKCLQMWHPFLNSGIPPWPQTATQSPYFHALLAKSRKDLFTIRSWTSS